MYLDAFLFVSFTKIQDSFSFNETIELCDESTYALDGETSSRKALAGLANIIINKPLRQIQKAVKLKD